MQDRADPHARERAFYIARQDPPPGVSPQAAVAEIREVLESIGDTCPECTPEACPRTNSVPAGAPRRRCAGPKDRTSRKASPCS